jgi:hypothetical protein
MKLRNSTKQLFKQSGFFALALAMALTSCKDEKGEVSPAETNFEKAYENGFTKGTIKGTRKDGTAFEEAFEYKITFDHAGFESISATEHVLTIRRSKGINDNVNKVFMNVKVTNKDQPGATAKFNGAFFEFSKQLANRDLFLLKAGPSFVTKEITMPMSKTNNTTYKLVNQGIGIQFQYDQAAQMGYYMAKDTDGNSIFFENRYNYDPGLNMSYFPFSHIITGSGVKSTSSSLWSNIRLYRNNGNDIFRTSTGTNLSETIGVPADTQEITNFAYNAATGLVSFDYKLTINEYRDLDKVYEIYQKGNTTMHPLEIKGSFSGTVYNGIVMRKGFE